MKKVNIVYRASGEITLNVDDDVKREDVIRMFMDKVGFSNDDLYENLDHNFTIEDISNFYKEMDKC